MEENQNVLGSDEQLTEPKFVDNSENGQTEEIQSEIDSEERQSNDLADELILGKFKSVDELSKAYLELQKSQGKSSQELGELRKESSKVNDLSTSIVQALDFSKNISEVITMKKYLYFSFASQFYRRLLHPARVSC